MQGKLFGDCISPNQKNWQQEKKNAGGDTKKTVPLQVWM